MAKLQLYFFVWIYFSPFTRKCRIRMYNQKLQKLLLSESDDSFSMDSIDTTFSSCVTYSWTRNLSFWTSAVLFFLWPKLRADAKHNSAFLLTAVQCAQWFEMCQLSSFWAHSALTVGCPARTHSNYANVARSWWDDESYCPPPQAGGQSHTCVTISWPLAAV